MLTLGLILDMNGNDLAAHFLAKISLELLYGSKSVFSKGNLL
jgi:hypothetical protein